ncbi:hypothetical protein SAMN06265365_103120 [Tistlia consotensis]|uniref:Thiamine biosynthesis protein ApbE n=1 Tax=Tistlia consotensis USBA 355 TaxID=560819 RepID=A0A1Y6BMN7_9PROT|nr:hypothetical protein [Tistlia consotensis]SMF17540.1 hypothetical protein SAMN05428998_106105 [Tistlia consotensis USBA 355]SNR40367.1 hypothetical protein SAMN06265365_103120 [Tistlia consotensis]
MSVLAEPVAGRLLPGNRLHLQDGPIDLVIGAEGEPAETEAAYRQAERAFHGLLPALVAELPLLTAPVPVSGSVSSPRHDSLSAPSGGRGWGEVGDPDLDAGAPPLPQHPTSPRPSPPRRGGEGVLEENGDATAWLSSFRHPVARAMAAACLPHAALWVTPMAAVAGAVADFVLAAMTEGRSLTKAWVNDGGDVACHLAPGAVLELGLVTDLAETLATGAPRGLARIAADSPVRGAATSGRQGRSLSRGIADSVTVLARTAAEADAAATLIGNAVDLEDHPAVRRRPACELVPDSDLGALPVVVGLGPLAPHELERALAAGAALAGTMRRAGLIEAALITLRGKHRAVPHGPIGQTREPA